jgi:hypothetical protein
MKSSQQKMGHSIDALISCLSIRGGDSVLTRFHFLWAIFFGGVFAPSCLWKEKTGGFFGFFFREKKNFFLIVLWLLVLY